MTEDPLAEVRAMIRLHAWWTRRIYKDYTPHPMIRWRAIEVELSEPTVYGIWQVVLEGPFPDAGRLTRPTLYEFLDAWVPV